MSHVESELATQPACWVVAIALVAGEVAGLSWSDRLRRAAALGAAAVHEPVADLEESLLKRQSVR